MGAFDFLSGGLGDLLGGLAGGAASAAGAKAQAQAQIQAAQINAQAQEQINQQQLAQSAYQFGINQSMADRSFTESDIQAQGGFMPAIGSNILKEAQILGVNPINLSGATPGSSTFAGSVGGGVPNLTAPTVSGASPGGNALEKMGQALQALDFGSKQDDLKLKALELQNVSTTQDIIAKQITNSQLANATQPGHTAVKRTTGNTGSGDNPLFQTFQTPLGPVDLFSKGGSESQMNWASMMMAPVTMAAMLAKNLQTQIGQWNITPGSIADRLRKGPDAPPVIGNPMGDMGGGE